MGTNSTSAMPVGRVTVVSWNYHHGRRHCVSETVELLKRKGMLECLVANTYQIFDSNLKENNSRGSAGFRRRLFLLVVTLAKRLLIKTKMTLLRERLFDYFASRSIGNPEIVYLDAERFPLTAKIARKKGITTIIYQRMPHMDYLISVLTEEQGRRGVASGHLQKGLNMRRVNCVNNADFILAHSGLVKDLDVANGLDEARIRVVHGCVDSETYRPPASRNIQPTIVLFVGNEPVLKGLFYLLDAWKIVKSKKNSAQLWIAGWGTGELGNLYKDLPDVSFLGLREDMVALYQKASLLVHPALMDGGPKAVTEAMSSGLPVIVTNRVGYREIVTDYHNGFVVPVRDPAALADRIMYFLSNPDELMSMGRNARATAKKLNHQAHAHKVVNGIIWALTSGDSR